MESEANSFKPENSEINPLINRIDKYFCFFADDSRQRKPSRSGMGELVGIGGMRIPLNMIYILEKIINIICKEVGFPDGEEFKWSPGRELWMHDNLIGEKRLNFFARMIELVGEFGGKVSVVINDKNYRTATGVETHEYDVARLFLERVENHSYSYELFSFVIVDRPGGNRKDEDSFLADCLETIQQGTKFVKPSRIIHNVLSTPSHLSRLLQVADLIASCTMSFVSGENEYSPKLFSNILQIMESLNGRIGGCGLKIHPDFIYANLYHWLLGDQFLMKGLAKAKLPLRTRPYFKNANEY